MCNATGDANRQSQIAGLHTSVGPLSESSSPTGSLLHLRQLDLHSHLSIRVIMSHTLAGADRKFYHGSMDHLAVGTILRPGPNYEKHWSNTSFYAVLERYRPRHLLPHAQAVFLCGDPDDVDLAGGGTEWMFEVKPLGPLQKHDMNWSSAISGAVDDNSPEEILKELAENYWNGVPHPDGSVWEYLVPNAEILRVMPFEELFDFECPHGSPGMNGC